jgi:hypothetical protein
MGTTAYKTKNHKRLKTDKKDLTWINKEEVLGKRVVDFTYKCLPELLASG